MKLKNTLNHLLIIIVTGLSIVSCKKSSHTDTPANAGNFWHGYIGASSSQGPGNAILLRNDGTMRQYANNYYSAGTTMAASDTTSALIKLDGTYVTTTGSSTIVTATWYQPNSSPALTYTLTGTVAGNAMTGTIKSAGTGISTVANFTFTNTP
ncbi:hypothetical protein [Ferruginibacter sp. SUN106]|uniref:hypothetical protein n=1 Tax=Ferruginibacter sp. SUN106 TaxID=2978348 RepID=UPI003D35B03B